MKTFRDKSRRIHQNSDMSKEVDVCDKNYDKKLVVKEWNILDFVNTISQVVIALCAIIAIVITIRQVRYIGKANIKGYYRCALGAIEYNDSKEIEVVAGVNIKIINMGLSPVYIEYCGLEFIGKERNSDYPGIMTTSEVVCINPGESYDGTISHIELLLDKIDDEVSLHDRVYVYVQLCNGEEQKWKTDDDYATFKHECTKMINRAEEENKTFKDE